MHRLICLAMVMLMLAVLPAGAADYDAGVARIKITPTKPIKMSGYASRTSDSMGVALDLYAKALALRDPQGGRAVIVTMDLIGLSGGVSREICARAEKQYGLKRSEIALMCSHTHSGPVIRDNLEVMLGDEPEDKRKVREYTTELVDKLVEVIGLALRDMAPAKLESGHGTVGFAINRREKTPAGVKLGLNPGGLMDHDVPVLKVSSPDGKLRAIFYGYACHNTSIGGSKTRDFFLLNGDYAGFSQAELEQQFPGATAMFTILCGGDQNPNPRGTLDDAKNHGKELAAAVAKALEGEFRPVRGPIRTAEQTIKLDFAAHTRKTFEDELAASSPGGAKPDKYRAARARMMLEKYDRGRPARQLAYPMQAIRLGEDMTMLCLAGEVTVGYQVRSKQEFAGANLMVIGYANDELGYIPTLEVLKGGGYEPDNSQVYYGHPGPYAENVEEVMMAGIHEILGKVGVKAAK